MCIYVLLPLQTYLGTSVGHKYDIANIIWLHIWFIFKYDFLTISILLYVLQNPIDSPCDKKKILTEVAIVAAASASETISLLAQDLTIVWPCFLRSYQLSKGCKEQANLT